MRDGARGGDRAGASPRLRARDSSASSRDREFGEYVDARTLMLRRTAYLLCGDWHRAEDLVQTALAKIYVAWPRLRRDGNVDAYARKVLVRTAIDESRRAFRRRETVMAFVPEDAAVSTGEGGLADSMDVRRALTLLPPGQRAVIVLRYWEDMSVADTAKALGCSEGTVKSQAAKGIAALRKLLTVERMSVGEVR